MHTRPLPPWLGGLIALALALLSGCRFDGAGMGAADGAPADHPRAPDELHIDGPPGEGVSLDADPSGLAPGDGRLLFGRSDDGDLHALLYRRGASSWLGDGLPISGALTVHWVLARLHGSEEVVAVKASEGAQHFLRVLSHQPGADWKVDALLPVSAENLEYRDYGLAIEGLSDNALFVHMGGNAGQPGQLVFQRRVGGSWSGPQAVFFPDGQGGDLLSDTVRWVELVAHAGSDHVALVAADKSGTLAVTVWDGASWGTPELLTNVLRGASSGDIPSRAFDAAFEESGQLLVAWGRDDADGLNWATRSAAGAWSARPALGVPAGKVDFVDLAAQPQGDHVAAVFVVQDGNERLGLGTWNGLTWLGADDYGAALRDLEGAARGDFTAAVGWSGDQAITVYPGVATGLLDWYSWSAGGDGRWQPGVAVAMPNKSLTESVLLGTSVDPSAGLLAVLSDQHGELHGARYAAGGWTVLQSGQPLASKLQRSDTLCFDLARR